MKIKQEEKREKKMVILINDEQFLLNDLFIVDWIIDSRVEWNEWIVKFE